MNSSLGTRCHYPGQGSLTPRLRQASARSVCVCRSHGTISPPYSSIKPERLGTTDPGKSNLRPIDNSLIFFVGTSFGTKLALLLLTEVKILAQQSWARESQTTDRTDVSQERARVNLNTEKDGGSPSQATHFQELFLFGCASVCVCSGLLGNLSRQPRRAVIESISVNFSL